VRPSGSSPSASLQARSPHASQADARLHIGLGVTVQSRRLYADLAVLADATTDILAAPGTSRTKLESLRPVVEDIVTGQAGLVDSAGVSVTAGLFSDADAWHQWWRPVLQDQRTVAVAGAGLSMESIERTFLLNLGRREEHIALITETGNVVASNSARFAPGTRFAGPHSGPGSVPAADCPAARWLGLWGFDRLNPSSTGSTSVV
jgi:hypothetical protein